jgi:DNA-binding Lrp family transcriptional regulator
MPTISSGGLGILAAMAEISPNSPSSPMVAVGRGSGQKDNGSLQRSHGDQVCDNVSILDTETLRSSPTREDVVVHAYILVQTEVGKAAEVALRIGQISGVTQAEDVTGPYDVIVRAMAENVDDLGRLVVAQIQAVDGITRTLTCPVVRL